MVKRPVKLTISAGSCQAVRQTLPDALKAKFGSLGFVKWTCAYSPVLIVDPMQMVLSKAIPEGIYHAWVYQFYLNSSFRDDDGDDDETHDNDTPLEFLPVLIYWFGTQYEFSIVRYSHVVDWKKGCRLGYNQLPEFMAERIQILRRPVPSVYSLLEDALHRVNEQAAKLLPEQRSLAVVAANSKKKHNVVLNEWHALAMDDPPQLNSWLEQKDLLMRQLPHVDMFGQVAFLPKQCGHITYHHPVLILSPFRVPPKRRTEWFHKCSSGRLIMVYWMGAYTSGRLQNSAYTFHKPTTLIPLREGLKRGYDKVPRNVIQEYERKNLPEKKLAGIDLWVCAVMWELPQALEREPKDRWGGLEDFEEDHDDDFEYYRNCLPSVKIAGTVVEFQDSTIKKRKINSNKQMIEASASPHKVFMVDDNELSGKGRPEGLPVSHRHEKVEESYSKMPHKVDALLDDTTLEVDKGKRVAGGERLSKASDSPLNEAQYELTPCAPNPLSPTDGSQKISIREKESDDEVGTFSGAYRPTAAAVTESPTESEEAVHDAVQDSLLECAAYLQTASQEAVKRRAKRKAEKTLLSPPKTNTCAKVPDRILQLKRRKEATQKAARGAIQQLSIDL